MESLQTIDGDLPSGGNGIHRVPWYCYVVVIGVACLPIGMLWDISWHISIGRDTFWAPAHIVIQLGGIVPGLVFGWLAFKMTFLNPSERESAVRLWGAYAPLGAWVAIWGAIAMVTSAPFDDWWHNAYGLDVKIVSPPHVVLGVGMFAVALGVLLFVHSWQNRLFGNARERGAILCAAMLGLMLTTLCCFLTEYTWPNLQHGALFYQLAAIHFPFFLLMTARASKRSLAATIAAITYLIILLAFVWILPLFHAQPKLAPIYNPVDHMAPPPFPLLLIIPAFAIDLLNRWISRRPGEIANEEQRWFERIVWRDWMLAVAAGTVFVLLFFVVQWRFSEFLLGPAGHNQFFGGNKHWPYYTRPGEWMSQFWELDKNPITAARLAVAFLFACLSARGGLSFGNWLLRVRR